MSKKSNKIKVLTTKDKQCINMLSKTGQATINHLNNLNGISQNRVDKLVNSGLINKSISIQGNIYTLGKNAQPLINNGIYHTAGLKHDLKLTEQYLNLTSEQQEHSITGDYYAREHGLTSIGTPDLVVTINNEIVFVEIITPNYKDVDIQLKQEFATSCNAQLILTNTNGGK